MLIFRGDQKHRPPARSVDQTECPSRELLILSLAIQVPVGEIWQEAGITIKCNWNYPMKQRIIATAQRTEANNGKRQPVMIWSLIRSKAGTRISYLSLINVNHLFPISNWPKMGFKMGNMKLQLVFRQWSQHPLPDACANCYMLLNTKHCPVPIWRS